MLAAELRRPSRQEAAGGTNQLDGALGDAKFCAMKRKAGCRARSSGELSDTRSFNGIKIIFSFYLLLCHTFM